MRTVLVNLAEQGGSDTNSMCSCHLERGNRCLTSMVHGSKSLKHMFRIFCAVLGRYGLTIAVANRAIIFIAEN